MCRRSILFLLSIALLLGCREDEEPPTEADVSMMIDHAFAEKGILPLFAHLNALRLGPGKWHPGGEVPCITLDSIEGDTAAFPMNGPVTAHLHFAASGCTGLDGVERSGTLLVRYDSIPGIATGIIGFSTADMTMGVIRVRFGTVVTIQNATATTVYFDSSFVHYQGAWSRRFRGSVYYALDNAPLDSVPQDDRYSVLFDLVGYDKSGRAYGTIPSTPLELLVNCAWITEGREDFTFDDDLARSLDHGEGCDDHVELHAGESFFGLTIP